MVKLKGVDLAGGGGLDGAVTRLAYVRYCARDSVISHRLMSASNLYKIPLQPDGKPEPGKISEMFLEFAQPLLSLDPAGPPDVRAIQSVMMLAELCWNLPVFERLKAPRYSAFQQQFDAVVRSALPPVADALRKLLADRSEEYGQVPFLISVRVEGTSLDNARIVAEARMPTSGAN